MTDRVPGAPGQYKAVVTEEELLKMQAGEQFTITMTRDDQPITEGTPYSKAAVLPDELAQRLCPDVEDPTPADALAALLPLRGGTMTGALCMGGNKITELADPTADTDAVNLQYLNNAKRFFRSVNIPTGSSQYFDLPAPNFHKNYIGVIRAVNPAWVGIYAFCGSDERYYCYPIVTNEKFTVSCGTTDVWIDNAIGYDLEFKIHLIDLS